MNWRRTAWVLAVLVSLVVGFGTAEASQADGTWRIHNLVLRIYDCQQSICGRIVWMKDVAKRPSQCGQTIIWGLSQTTLI
jgi:hypothetical protein